MASRANYQKPSIPSGDVREIAGGPLPDGQKQKRRLPEGKLRFV
jgi:hypothetical protein